MRKVYDRFVAVMVFLSGSLCVVMLGIVLVGLFYRYVIDEALSWYDEFAGYLLVWLTMAGSVVGLARRKHIGFAAWSCAAMAAGAADGCSSPSSWTTEITSMRPPETGMIA